MALEHEHHGAELTHGDRHHPPGTMPATLAAPAVVGAWRTRAAIVAVVFAVLSVLLFVWTPEGRNHLLRAYLMGYMTVFNFCGGALCFLMVQYVSGGKWGQVLRRPLEAMTRTIWVVILMLLPVLFLMRHLYQWAAFPTAQDKLNAYAAGLMTHEQQLTAQAKVTMLSPLSAWIQAGIVLGFMALVTWLLNRWSLQRDADPDAGTPASYDRWRIRFENLSGPGILVYVIMMTDFVILFVKSLDVTWYSSVYGLQFLVAQGYGVLALGILTLILLARYEPMKTFFRYVEQHDLGKLAFAFVMLNIYLTFAEFLIIWSGNVPDEIPWYLHRIHGGWWTICTLDVTCHWLIPFCILLSRDIKRSRYKMIWVTSFMIFARLIDMFWLIEPNFRDAASNLHISGNIGILAYITVPISVIAFWMVFYFHELTKRPLINVNDPHTAELLEPNMPTEGHSGDKMPTPKGMPHGHPSRERDAQHPGYETQDVNPRGIAVFLAGFLGFVLIFFVFCFFMGKVMNYALLKQDGPPNKWQPNLSQAGVGQHGATLDNLHSSAEIEQKQLAAVTQAFPTPRLAIDGGDQDTADLHAREDLLLNYYSTSPDLPAGTIRIPIARAMQLIVQHGLPTPPAAAQPAPPMVGDNRPVVTAPLTDGFARTGYELAAMQSRKEKNDFNRAEGQK